MHHSAREQETSGQGRRLVAKAAFGLVIAFALAPAAQAAVHITGSVSSSTSNVPYTLYTSRAGSGSVAFDLGPYVRLGYTHRQEITQTDSWEKYRPGAASQYSDVTDADGNVYMKAHDIKHVISNSIDLTLILYQGQVFVPYLLAGAVVKSYSFSSHKGYEEVAGNSKITTAPVVNLGAGLDLRLNRDFSLRLSYVASPGVAQEPNGEIVKVWDLYTTVGLTYRI